MAQENGGKDSSKIGLDQLDYYDGDIIGLYQESSINKGFCRYSPIFFTLKRESIVRREII